MPSSCMCLTYVKMHSLKLPHSLHASPYARFARLPHLLVNAPSRVGTYTELPYHGGEHGELKNEGE